MIHYSYKQAKLLFVGINPHYGSYDRGVPFSNNKTFWYQLSDAGILPETRDELRSDETLKSMYKKKFSGKYGLGFVNIIERPTRNVAELRAGEELQGRKKISDIIRIEMPKVVCFVGRITYEKYSGSKDFSFGWQNKIDDAKIFVMHYPLRGEAIVRVRELKEIAQAAFPTHKLK